MKIVCNIKAFREAIGVLGRVVGGRNSSEASRSILIDAHADGTKLQAYSETMSGLYRPLGVRVDDPGLALIPHGWLSQVLAVATADLEIAVTAKAVEIRSGKSSWRTQTRDEVEFAVREDGTPDAPVRIRVEAAKLAKALSSTIPACDPNSTRSNCGGPSVQMDGDDALAFAGTNGSWFSVHRLRFTSIDGKFPEASPIIPAAASSVFVGVLAKIEGEVDLFFGDASAWIATDSLTLRASLLQGRAPAWRRVVTTEIPADAKIVDSRAIRDGVKAVSLAMDDACKHLEFVADGDAVTLTVPSAQAASTEFPCGSEGRSIDHRLSGNFLGLGIAQFDDESLSVYQANDANPLVHFAGADLIVAVGTMHREPNASQP